MTQHDRGAYTPQTDAPLAFDARAPRGGRRPLPMALIGSAVVLLVLVAAVVMYYRSGVRSPDGAPVAVGEPIGAVKTAPAASAANDDPFSNLDVYAAQNVPATPTATQPAFVPPPEQPQPRPAPQPGLKVQTVESSAIKPVPATPSPAKPTTAPAAAPHLAPPPAPAPTTAVATAPAAKPPAAPAIPATTPAAAPPAGGPASVQIGAYSSAALADKGFSEVAAAFPGFTVGKAKRVEPLARDGKTLYRTSFTGFASRSAAQAFCEAMKAAGRACLVKG